MSDKHVGQPLLRKEDPRLLRGQGRYLDDLGRTALAAAFVRSPVAHARVTDIDVVDALDVEGLVAIYTYEDLPDRVAAPLPLLIPHPDLTHARTPHCLANGEVNHVGEAVVMVVATDRYIAEDAAERIRVSYDELPPVVGIDQARAGERLVHADVPANVAARSVQENGKGDVHEAIAAAPHRLTLDLAIERSASMPMEGKGVLAHWDADDRTLRVHSSTQTSTSVRLAVAAKLGLPPDRVEVITPDVGGGFGVKIVHPWPEEILVPWAAMTLGQDVKWVEDRREHFISSAHERGQQQRIEVGFDGSGRLRGLSVEIWHDNGAYVPYGIIVPIVTSTQLLGPYKVGVYRVEFTSLYTNTVIVTPYRGAGRPQGVFAMERTLDAIAEYLGLDRLAVREANLIQPEEMPYDQGLVFQDGRPLIYDSGDYPTMLRMIRELVGWDGFDAERAAAAEEGRRIGIGVAAYVEGTGMGPYEGAHVKVETTGEIVVSTGLTTQGQGHYTTLAQIAADVLGVAVEDVTVITGDTRRFKYAVGTFASRAIVTSGNAVAVAAGKVAEKAKRIAAAALGAEVSPEDLELVGGVVRRKDDHTAFINLQTVAVLSNPLRYAFDEAAKAATQFAHAANTGDEPGLEAIGYYMPERSTFAAGAHGVVVETDPETADIRILRYCVVHDCGVVVNPRIVEGQVHGGVAQGIGGALYERIVYDDAGQLVNASYMDFLMPFSTEVPHIQTAHMVTASGLNPLGLKGAGEAGVIPTSAAVASAIEDAERAQGLTIRRMPISPSELYELRKGRVHA
jgi:CO/xanthine dehydrogenase Mo-binding subunit